jgi:hypothetical protein
MLEAVWASVLGLWMIVPFGFWMLMIFDCLRHDPDRQVWIWVLFFFNVPAAFIYFVARWLPRSGLTRSPQLARWTRRQDLWNAESAVRNIGKAHQFVQLGNVLNEMREFDQAATAYATALQKEPENQQALWGMVAVERELKQFEQAKTHLQTLLKLQPDFKYGDASLAYAQTLFALGEVEATKQHLKQHFKSWSQPEAHILMAQICQQEGDLATARASLETLLAQVRGGPAYYYKRNRQAIGQAERLLSNLRRKSA